MAANLMSVPGISGNFMDTSSSSWESQARKRLEAAKESTELLAQIRSQPGFENFLLPPSTTEMKDAADPDPTIVVNLNQIRCDAFLVQQ